MSAMRMVKATQRCEAKAKLTGKRHCVVEMDRDEGRAVYIVEESYTFDDEFEAFAGEVLYISECGE